MHTLQILTSNTPILPENQNTNIPSYFDLNVKPDQKQNLMINIKNNSEENVKYNIYVNTAVTNQNGIIDYSISDFEKDKSMKVSLKDCIVIEEPQVEIPANSEKIVSLALSVPEIPFEGIVLGGITVEPTASEGKEGVNNVFTRTLAVQLSESRETIIPKLESGAVKISQENLRNNIKFELRNTSPTIISKIKAKISIINQRDKKTVIEQTKEPLSFAPNSIFFLMTEWNEQFKPGKYTYTINLSDEEKNKWKFTKNFEIKEEVVKKLNKTSVDQQNSSSNDPFLSITILILIGTLLWLVLKIVKKNSLKKN
ncbi:DUF916 and DUF3324 domain-containing protein [Enterococcus sp. DIV0869a]|uniref:DUF916 and DUF3324 domain-containing protein n=1 Tax=Candidatus Enterococcus ikei TaxID=2815326 RepID=A0ABS3H182_9ENTE|nr:DUF916 and DUF3324 domain-containing protein [Enterococcus sp. DIV0869a]